MRNAPIASLESSAASFGPRLDASTPAARVSSIIFVLQATPINDAAPMGIKISKGELFIQTTLSRALLYRAMGDLERHAVGIASINRNQLSLH